MSHASDSGFASHHDFPVFMGGDENEETMLLLCPNHHRRQHSLIRYLVENPESSREVMCHFTAAERATAAYAVAKWRSTVPLPVLHLERRRRGGLTSPLPHWVSAVEDTSELPPHPRHPPASGRTVVGSQPKVRLSSW